jgi:hypothetical protein
MKLPRRNFLHLAAAATAFQTPLISARSLRDGRACQRKGAAPRRPGRESICHRAFRTLRSLSFVAMALWLVMPARSISSIIGSTAFAKSGRRE